MLIIKNIGKKERRQGLFKNRKTAFDISQKWLFSFCGTDNEIIQMLSEKKGKKISETPFYRPNKKAKAKRGESEE